MNNRIQIILRLRGSSTYITPKNLRYKRTIALKSVLWTIVNLLLKGRENVEGLNVG